MKDHLKIILVQQRLLGSIPDDDFRYIQSEQPDFVCLPEYFFIPENSRGHTDEAIHAEAHLKKLQRWSLDWRTVLVGGSIVEWVGNNCFNTCYVFDRGSKVGCYSKVNLFKGEVKSGITPGTGYRAFDIRGVRVGVLICADVLNPKSFLEMNARDCDIVFVPTTSPYKTESVEEKYRRDADIFERGAKSSRAFVAKCCAVGSLFGNELQGRSLVASPEGILQRVEPSHEHEARIISQEVSWSWIRQWKKEH